MSKNTVIVQYCRCYRPNTNY